jgi:biotin transport system substrate-specific component
MIVAIQNNLIDNLYTGHLNIAKDILICVLGAIGISLLAQVSFQLPFTPVPITALSLGILIIGSNFGMKRALISSSFYVSFGVLGLPVFSNGKFGLIALTGPTGGYIIGFILAATIMGYLGDRQKDRTYKSSFLLFFIGHIIIFLSGLVWLKNFVPEGKLLVSGLYPFIPGMLVKTILAGGLTPIIWKKIKK